MAGRQTIVGAFVLGGIILAVAAIVLFGNFNPFSHRARALVVFQGSANGLSVGSPVTFRGVRVGAVTDVAIALDQKTYTALIPVTVELQSDRVRLARAPVSLDMERLVAHGLRAELNLQSLVTGQSQIDLTFAPDTAATLHPGLSSLTEIPSRQSAIQKARETLEELPLKEIAERASATLQSVQHLSDRLETDLPRLIDSLRETSDHSRQAVDLAGGAISDLHTRLDTTLAGLDRLTASTARQIDSRGADLHALAVSATKAVDRTNRLVAELHDIAGPRSADRADLEATLRDLAAASASLRGLAGDLERHPQLLLRGRQP